MRTGRLPLVAVLALTCAAACGGDDDEPVERATTTSAEATTTTRAQGPTTTAAPGCDPVALPDEVADLVETSGDVDADGASDAIRSYRVGEQWHLQAQLRAGGGADLAITTLGGGGVRVLGGADVDGDGADEVWAQTGLGASATVIGLARLDGCGLAQVTIAPGTAAEFPVGGSVGTAAGLECDAVDPAGNLTAYTATNTGDGEYDVQAVEYALQGTGLLELGRRTEHASVSDDLFVRATTFRCGDLSL